MCKSSGPYAYWRLKRTTEAIGEYKEAIRLKPDYATAHYNLGVTYVESGNRNAAMVEYEILAKLKPDSAEKLYKQISAKQD